METTLVVLAAGIGRRYGGLKQLEPVGPGGEALLEYSIFDAVRAGFDRVALVVRPETEDDFMQFFGDRLGNNVTLSYAYQRLCDVPTGVVPPPGRSKPWGTGHAVLAAQGVVQGPFAVINADDYYGAGSFAAIGNFLRGDHHDAPSTFALAGFRVGPTLSAVGPVSRGLCRADDDGWLERIVEILKLEKDGDGGRYTDDAGIDHLVPGNELVSMNMWAFTPALFPVLRNRFHQFFETPERQADESSELMLPEVVQGMIDNGSARVRVLRHNGRWCGITFPDDRERVKEFIADLVTQGEYPAQLWG